jgi:diguanylate cyclase (GGDEF)-like protein
MDAATIPLEESIRLQALHSLHILDTGPEERFDRLTRLAKRLFGVSVALVSLVDENRQWFKSRAGLVDCETPRSISFCAHAILGEEVLVVPDTWEDPRFHDNPLVTGEPHIRFYAGCPIKAPNGSRLGTLCLIDSAPRNFSDDDKEFLRDIARIAEGEFAALQLAITDELTELPNRRGFELMAQQALNFCKRSASPASLLFFDLNGFKQINDEFGHAEGDHALSLFATVMQKAFRQTDVLGRLGGDEFVAVLTGTDLDEAQVFVDRLQHVLELRNREEARGYSIRFSVGKIDCFAAGGASIASLVPQADAAMYQNKLGSHDV